MGTMPVNKLLITMSLPMMVAMLVQAMYNVVDSVFVAQIDAESLGLAAVSMAFPVQSLMIAFATGTGVGVNALLSRRLGEKKLKEASLTAKNGIFVILITYIVFALFGIFGSRLFFSLQTTDTRVIEMGVQYLSVCCIFSFGLFLEIILERLLQSTGKTIYTMFTQGAGAIINIIFDPLLIFGIGPFPKMGVQGAAVATVAGQIVAAALAFLFNHWKNHEI
ncbi:MAG: MATE family efflux transporter, partial [Massilioclostridium sp.]